jgi:uncharacterized protein
MTEAGKPARFPGQAAIDAYGNGGFRFAGMSHKGSLLMLPSGIKSWSAVLPADVDLESLGALVPEKDGIEIFLYGSGEAQVFPSKTLREALAGRGLFIEAMTTGAACHTYNILLAEGRAVAAAVLAVP